ncbi:11652_t:CDS:1 [Diversispora eburnea]|uniref:11652_t:CDS:1 n=1 Tax=Diversispora eburnea TaxID=1213867 RepID=A0A9N8ZWL9_9GLOM|nr:11652_t:CDS:1 [Diversispora eburnea]
MKIYINSNRGDIIQLNNTEEKSSIFNLKKSIEKALGVPTEDQKLFFFSEALENDKELSDYKICTESTLHLKFIVQNNIQVNVEINNYTPPIRKNLKFDVKPTNTIYELKQKIPCKALFTRLFFFGEQLRDDRTLESYKICDESTLCCTIFDDQTFAFSSNSFFIFVKTSTSELLNVKIFSDNTIAEIKEILHREEGFPKDNQILCYNQFELDDEKTISDYYIYPNCTINLTHKKLY